MLPKQTRYGASAITGRADYSWPEGKRLAFWIAINIETFGFRSGVGPDPVMIGSPQTHRNYAWRDYGNRVGVWQLFDLFDEMGLPTSCLVNSYLYDEYPEIFERIRARGDAIVGHGRTNAEWQNGMWEDDERRLITDATATIESHEGQAPRGWLGPGSVESSVTPDLLKEAGYEYVLDWPCDDQPIWLDTRAGKILSVPYPFELNDIGQIVFRHHTAREFCDMLVDQFDEMVRQSVDRPLVCCVSLHTYIAGQPFRLAPLRKALQHIIEHQDRDRVWFTHSDAIAEHCYSLEPGIIPGS